MTTDCERAQQSLLDGAPASDPAVREHIAVCSRCDAVIRTFDEISATARELRGTWESPELWQRIESSIRTEVAGTRAATGRLRRWHDPRVWQIAAAFVLVIGIGAVAMRVATTSPDGEEYDRWLLRESALQEVEKSEKAYMQSIDRLSSLVEPAMDDASTPLAIAYREKLMLLDSAIAECQAAIDANRQNAHLRHQLLAVYREKNRTLQDLVREEANDQQITAESDSAVSQH
ncbi:MAG TPA: hypothetical protein VMT00_11085 [Thermoanaerobaculia bacterium]|nr:hypothetical protein [Thermoanaerobaculia bacterium]